MHTINLDHMLILTICKSKPLNLAVSFAEKSLLSDDNRK